MVRKVVRTACGIVLILGIGVLQGCVYDPYTGAYAPCCAYPAYGYYPAPYAGSVVLDGDWGWRRGWHRR